MKQVKTIIKRESRNIVYIIIQKKKQQQVNGILSPQPYFKKKNQQNHYQYQHQYQYHHFHFHFHFHLHSSPRTLKPCSTFNPRLSPIQIYNYDPLLFLTTHLLFFFFSTFNNNALLICGNTPP